jgi:hypothetical protein
LNYILTSLLFFLLIAECSLAACLQKVAIAPAPTNDWFLASRLSTEVSSILTLKEKGRCWNFKSLDLTSKAFDIVGSTTGFPRQANQLGQRQVDYLREVLEVTHLLFIDHPLPNGKVKVHLYSISDDDRLRLEQTYDLSVAQKFIEANSSSSLLRFLARVAANALTTGYSNTDVYFDVDKRFGEGTIRNKGFLPPLVSSVALSRIEHRRGYGLFDYAGSIFPGGYLFGIDQVNTYNRLDDETNADQVPETLNLNIETYGSCATGNAQGSLFSPLGTTFVGIGLGPCLVWLKSLDRDALWYGKTAVRYFFGHRVFFTDQVFFELNWDSLVFHQELQKTDYAIARQVERFGLALGWYIPDSERLASTLWRQILSRFQP